MAVDKPSMSRILVTGGNGFVGRNLVAALAAREGNCDIIVGTIDGHAPCVDDRIRSLTLDITNAGQVRSVIEAVRPTHLVHLAAKAAVSSAQRNVRQTWMVNLDGTLNVVLALAEALPDCRLLYCSSAEVYGASFRTGRPLDESAPLDPVNSYGASKAAADLMIGQMTKQGLRAVRVRPFNHTGPGQNIEFVVPAFAAQIARIERGEQPPVIDVGNLASRRDLLDVGDVVDAYCRIIARFDDLPAGCVMNLASGHAISIADILDKLVSMSPTKIEIVQDTTRMRASDTPVVVGDAGLARRLLGWEPKVDISSTLAGVLDYYRGLARA
jgi:GDP-4-dehydro-6-deoxy-D-mannose reductase